MEREENATKDCVTENWQPVRGCKVYTSSQILLVEDEIKRSKKTGQIQSLKWEESTGYISLEYAYLYPPGIPLIVPGELITEEAAALIRQYREAGFSVEGPACVDRIKVCKERLF